MPLNAVLFLQVAAAADTVLMRVVPGETSAFQKVLGVAQLGAVLLAYVLMGAAIFGIIKLYRSFEAAKSSLDEVGRDLKELVDNANSISRSATSIIDSVKDNIEGVNQTVEIANRRAQRAIGELADRIDEFNRTLSVVQSETQGAVVAAFSAIKGVKAGVSALRSHRRRKAEVRNDNGSDDLPVAPTGRPRLKRRVPVES
jgi:hypothetical protein